jgi:hypothetical protein
VETPERNETAPEEPPLLIPDRKDKGPLTPATPALADARVTPPLDVRVLDPLFNVTDPPVEEVLAPAVRDTSAPIPVPVPAEIEIAPATPLRADPVNREMLPVEPELDDPEVKVNAPLAPAVPAFLV